jgi:glycosyltransferase involved in cell wall biosynthesis
MSVRNGRVSVIVPFFNSGRDMVDALHQALGTAATAFDHDVELVYVDDGSSDDTMDALRDVQQRDKRVVVIELAANFGQHAAFSAGFDRARGQYLVTMDADLQCDPADIPALIAPLQQGYDLVSGIRRNRRDPLVRRMFSRVLARMIKVMTGVRLRDVGCPLNACTAEVAAAMSSFGELRRFLKPVALRVARRVAEVEITHRPRPRVRPQSSYSATGLIRLFMDFFVNTAGDVFAWVFVGSAALSGLSALLTLVVLALVAVGRTTWFPVFLAGSTTLLLAGTTLFGLAGDYVQRIYRQSSGRPFYLVRHIYESRPVEERA